MSTPILDETARDHGLTRVPRELGTLNPPTWERADRDDTDPFWALVTA